MPYQHITQLPKQIQEHLPRHAQEIYLKAFNSAYDQYDEVTAHKVAWAAVKRKYEKGEDDKWHLVS